MKIVIPSLLAYSLVGVWNVLPANAFLVRTIAVLQAPSFPTTYISGFLPSAPETEADSSDVKMCNENSTKPTTNADLLSIFQGDFAGWQASYDLEGRLIPIPAHYVPESLQEWGQVPPALEVLVSEDAPPPILPAPLSSSSSSDAAGPTTDVDVVTTVQPEQTLLLSTLEAKFDHWNRKMVTVLPATGCGVDNLETLVSNQAIDSACWYYSSCPGTGLLTRTGIYPASNQNDNNIFVVDTTLARAGSTERSRIELRIRLPSRAINHNINQVLSPQPISPIKVALERQISVTSSQWKVAEDGGLDGRSMAQWLGTELRAGLIGSIFAPSYQPKETAWSNDGYIQETDDRKCIKLPGNLTVSCGRKDTDYGDPLWLLETTLRLHEEDNDPPKELVVQHELNISTVKNAQASKVTVFTRTRA